MPKLHLEALLFALVWACLAIYGAAAGGWWAGGLLSAGLFLVIMPVTAIVLSKTGNLAAERQVRWGILALAAVALILWLNR